MQKLKIALMILGVIVFAGIFYFRGISQNSDNQVGQSEFQAQVSEQGGITFAVKPLDLAGQPKFEISIDTHSGSLDFDLVKISALEDDKGNEYEPIGWEGSASGGHHVAGTLIFPKLEEERVKSVKLTIRDNYLRVFEWSLE